MIYSWQRFLAIIAVMMQYINHFNGFHFASRIRSNDIIHPQVDKSTSKIHSVPDWLVGGEVDESKELMNDTETETVTVRFTNTISGNDVIVNNVPIGQNLLFLGDQNGVKLPRACRTGLCGSCTCEVEVPGGQSASGKVGLVTVRACSTRVFLPDGKNEMVVDLWRTKKMTKGGKGADKSVSSSTPTVDSFVDPMARFSGDWEKDFRPQWQQGEPTSVAISKSSISRTRAPEGQIPCSKCQGAGRVPCYACNGSGQVTMGTGKLGQCATCVGLKTCGCGYCRGSGFKARAKRIIN